MRLVWLSFAACASCCALVSGWAFYEFYWRWRGCFNELGRCFDPESNVVMTDESFVWGLMAAIALGLALIFWWLSRRRSTRLSQ